MNRKAFTERKSVTIRLSGNQIHDLMYNLERKPDRYESLYSVLNQIIKQATGKFPVIMESARQYKLAKELYHNQEQGVPERYKLQREAAVNAAGTGQRMLTKYQNIVHDIDQTIRDERQANLVRIFKENGITMFVPGRYEIQPVIEMGAEVADEKV